MTSEFDAAAQAGSRGAAARQLAADELAMFGAVAVRRVFARGEDVLADRARSRALMIVEVGAVVVQAEEGAPATTLRAGTFFNELAVLTGEEAALAARAIEPSTIAVVPMEAFDQLQRHESARLCRFLRRTVVALVASERALVDDLRRRNETLVVTLHSLQHMQSQLTTANDLVRTDELTGLTNRRGLYQYLDASHAVERHPAAQLGLVLFDLDDFKSINDRCGHHCGDDALRAVAAAVSALAAPGDLLCRLGGDEFALLVHVVHGDELELLSARAVSVVRALPAPCPGSHLSVSVGASLCRHGAGWSSWYRDADRALYAAKHAGGNGWRIARQPG